MIMRLIAASHSLEIDDPKNFKAFSLRVEGPLDAVARAELLGRTAAKHDREHAWIFEQALRDWPALRSEWRDQSLRQGAPKNSTYVEMAATCLEDLGLQPWKSLASVAGNSNSNAAP